MDRVSRTQRAAIMAMALVAWLAAGCSGSQPAADATWTGSIEIHSASVPSPYSWSKTAVLTEGQGDFSANWSPDDSGEPDNFVEETWTRTLSESDLTAITSVMTDLPEGAGDETQVGGCWLVAELTSSQAGSVNVTLSADDESFTQVVDLFDTLAGPENPTLPAHAHQCAA